MDIMENIPELDMEEEKHVETQFKEEKEVREVKPLAKADKVYQSVRAEILQREKEKSKGATRMNRDKKLRDVKYWKHNSK